MHDGTSQPMKVVHGFTGFSRIYLLVNEGETTLHGELSLAVTGVLECQSRAFVTTFTLSAQQLAQPLFLDLGQVGDIAEVCINGALAGVCA